MENDAKKNIENQELSNFSMKDFLKICLHNWWWFALSLIFAVGIALLYLYRKQPEYKRYEQILVNDQGSGGSMNEAASAFSSLGLFSKNTNVYNELLVLTSPAVLYTVADSLQLDMNYSIKDGIRRKTLYGSNQPFIVKMPDLGNQGQGSFRLDIEPDGRMKFYKFQRVTPDGKIKYDEEINASAGTSVIDSPLGKIQISSNPRYVPDGKKEPKTYILSKLPMQTTVELYSLKLSGDLADQDADVIELSIEDVSTQRADDILNYVLVVYNNNWLADKNKMSDATSKFINERLAIIESELGEVDRSIAEYKKQSGTASVAAELEANLGLNSKLEEDLLQLNNELTVAVYMKEYLQSNNNINTILPANLGFASADLVTQITTYNDLLMNRNTIASSSSPENPLVVNYDHQLTQMRNAISQSVNNQIAALQERCNNLQTEINKKYASIAELPELRLPLLSEERQQNVKHSLYLYLLQKREENELSQKFTSDNVRIITPPIGPLKPVSPRKGLIIIVGVILGIGVPLVVLYYLETSDTTVRSKKDLDILNMPFAGEVPQVGKKVNLKRKNKKLPLGKKKEDKAPISVVEEGKRDIVNEAFRVIRGNIDFMAGKNNGCSVIMLTSVNPGSGKSFIAYNLGLSFAIKGKKVLIIDCDLRHGSSSMYVEMPSTGLSQYLSGSTNNWENMVVESPVNHNLSILPIGKMAPNPSELLEEPRLQTLIEEAKMHYDIIFLDCPPVNIVVDTQWVARYADRTIFVVRAGLLEKAALKELNEFYEEKRYPNMSVLLNGTEAQHSRYHTYGNYQNFS